jgi:4-hydroxybenzoate polyprenyltransferase
MAWLKLIRWQNLLIVFLTQLLAWACVIVPMHAYSEVPVLITSNNFIFLSLSTVLIAAAGYIINDYFDIKIDAINRPHKMILEKRIPLRIAIIMHTVYNVVGISLAIIVARRAGHYSLALLQVGCTLLLWVYSTSYKRKFMTGNVVVALLTALTIITLMLFEPAIWHYATRPPFLQTTQGIIPNPVWVLGIYAYFAFMLTWMREIVKDMEDFKGDAEEGCITMPIKWGLLRSVRFTQLLGVLSVIPLFIGAIKLCNAGWWPLGIYTSVAIALPVCIWMFFLPGKANTQHYAKASRWLKIIMISGIGSLILYYFQAHV